MASPLLREVSNKEDSSTFLECWSIFDKYKQGRAHTLAPFRLFETNCNTSCEEDSDSE